MKPYYNEKKYYTKKAMKVAKKYNNKEAIEVLKMLLRQGNVYPVDLIKEITPKISDIDMFNIENVKK